MICNQGSSQFGRAAAAAFLLAALAALSLPVSDSKLDDSDAGGGGEQEHYFPVFHPRMHTAHNNDVNGPFFHRGVHRLFLQLSFPWAKNNTGTYRFKMSVPR
jgi:hypothetical protein